MAKMDQRLTTRSWTFYVQHITKNNVVLTCLRTIHWKKVMISKITCHPQGRMRMQRITMRTSQMQKISMTMITIAMIKITIAVLKITMT